VLGKGEAYILFPLQARPCLTLLQSHPHPALLAWKQSSMAYSSLQSCTVVLRIRWIPCPLVGFFFQAFMAHAQKVWVLMLLAERDKIEGPGQGNPRTGISGHAGMDRADNKPVHVQRVKPVTLLVFAWLCGAGVKAAAFWTSLGRLWGSVEYESLVFSADWAQNHTIYSNLIWTKS
jgi:hypothetical protein